MGKVLEKHFVSQKEQDYAESLIKDYFRICDEEKISPVVGFTAGLYTQKASAFVEDVKMVNEDFLKIMKRQDA